jgi:hypothetical protein
VQEWRRAELTYLFVVVGSVGRQRAGFGGLFRFSFPYCFLSRSSINSNLKYKVALGLFVCSFVCVFVAGLYG